MSDSDAYQEYMRRFSRLSDRELDSLLAGKAPSGNGDQAELAAFIRDLRASFQEKPAEATQARHLATIVEAAQLLAEGEDATATLVRPGLPPDRERSPRPRSRRNLVKRSWLSLPRAKLAAAAALMLLLLAAFGGAAYAGQLPDPVQAKVADIADNVGVQLNDGQHNDVDEGDVDGVDHEKHGNVDEGAKGSDQRGTGNIDEGAKGDVEEGAKRNGQRDAGNIDEGAKGDVDQGNGDLDTKAENDRDDKAPDANETENDVDVKGQNDVGNEPNRGAPTGTGDSGSQGAGSDQGDGSN